MLRRAKARDQGRALQHVRLEAWDLHYYTGLAKAGPTMPPCLPLGRLPRLTHHVGRCVVCTPVTTLHFGQRALRWHARHGFLGKGWYRHAFRRFSCTIHRSNGASSVMHCTASTEVLSLKIFCGQAGRSKG